MARCNFRNLSVTRYRIEYMAVQWRSTMTNNKPFQEARMEYPVTGAHMFPPPRVRAALPVVHVEESSSAPNREPR